MNIIAAENYKIFKDKSFRILFLISIAYFLISGIAIKYVSGANGVSGISGMTAPYYMGTFAMYILIFCGITAGTYTVNDFDRGTIRNALSTGTGRVSYYLSKLYTMFLSCIIFTLASSVTFTISVTIFVGWNGAVSGHYVLNLLVFYAVFFAHMFSYCSLFLMIAFLIRNVGGVIAITLAYAMLLENLIVMALMMPNISFLNTIAENMPSKVMSGLLQFVEADTVMTSDFVMKAVSALIIAAITTIIGIMSFVKRDIK